MIDHSGKPLTEVMIETFCEQMKLLKLAEGFTHFHPASNRFGLLESSPGPGWGQMIVMYTVDRQELRPLDGYVDYAAVESAGWVSLETNTPPKPASRPFSAKPDRQPKFNFGDAVECGGVSFKVRMICWDGNDMGSGYAYADGGPKGEFYFESALALKTRPAK